MAAAIGKVELGPHLVHEAALHVDACSWFGGGHFLTLRVYTAAVSQAMESTLCSQNVAVAGLGTTACYQSITHEVDAFEGPQGLAVTDNGLSEQQLVAVARIALASDTAR